MCFCGSVCEECMSDSKPPNVLMGFNNVDIKLWLKLVLGNSPFGFHHCTKVFDAQVY